MNRIGKLLENGEFQKVIEILESAPEKNVEDYVALGVAYYSIGKRNKAVSNLKKALQMDPRNVDALFNLAEIFLQLEKYPKAKEYALKLVQISPNDWAVHDILAEVYRFEGFYDKALDHLGMAIRLAPSEVIPHLKVRLDSLKDRVDRAKSMKKLAIVCAKGLDSFIDDIIKGLSDEYWVQRWAVTSDKEIKAAIDWADIVWLEWANEMAIIGTNYTGSWVKPVVVRLHGYEVFTNMIFEINWAVVDKIIFVADHKRKLFLEKVKNVSEERTTTIRNGIDIAKFRIKEGKQPNKNMAFVGNLNYRKGLVIMMMLLKEVVTEDPEYKLFIRGTWQDERYKMAIEHMIDVLDLRKSVVFVHEYIADLNEWFEDKTYILSTSIEESFHYSLGEGMLAGLKPVIFNWKESEDIWPKWAIFERIEEGKEMILSPEFEPQKYRDYVVSKYPLDKQIKEIKNLINHFGAPEKNNDYSQEWR